MQNFIYWLTKKSPSNDFTEEERETSERQNFLYQKILEGLELEKQNNFTQAIICYLEVLNIDFSCPEAHQALAEVFTKQGKTQKANFHFDQAINFKNKSIKNINSDFTNEILIESRNSIPIEDKMLSKQHNHNIDKNLESNSTNTVSLSSGTRLFEKRSHEINQLVRQSNEENIILPDENYLLNKKYLKNRNEKAGKVLLEQALLFYEDNQWARAIVTCQKVLKKSPYLAEACKIWGNCLQRQGKSSEAIELYAKAIEINPDFFEAYINMGSIFAKRGQKNKALNYYTQALHINPRSAAVHRNLARLWEELNDLDKAEEHLFQAINLEPKTLSAKQHLQLAGELIKEGKKAQAIFCCNHAIQLDHKFQEAYMQLINILEASERWHEASQCYRQLLKLQDEVINEEIQPSNRIQKLLSAGGKKGLIVSQDSNTSFLSNQNQSSALLQLPPSSQKISSSTFDNSHSRQQAPPTTDSVEAKLQIGNKYTLKQQWKEAIYYYKQAIKQKPDCVLAHHKLAQIYRKLGNQKQAIWEFYQVALLQPEKVTLAEYLQLGNILVSQDKIQEAINCFRQAIKLQPQHQAAYLFLGRLFRQQKKYDAEITCYRQLIKQIPDHGENYHLLGDALVKLDRLLEAIESYTKAIKLQPNNSWSYNNLGDVLLKLERWKPASKCYRKAIVLNSEFVWSYQNLGTALAKQEKWSEAIEAYHQAIKLKSDLPWSYYNLGDALAKVFRWSEAIEAYHQAIKLKPDFAEAYAHLGNALVREEKWQTAIEYYKQAIEIDPSIDVTVYRNLKEALDRQKYPKQKFKIESTSIVKEQQWPYDSIQKYKPPATLPDGSPWPRISIITPSYNQGEFIEETILSVINQNYPNIEYILIDGASTDKTQQVIDQYRDYFSYVVSEPDKGQSNAINKGFKQATGEIFTWLNSDDRLGPGALYAVALAFYTSRADIVAGVCQIFKDGVEIEQHLTSCSDGNLSLDDILDLENCWLQGKYFYQPEVMFTRAIWEKAGGEVNESLFYSMDYEMWVRFAANNAKLKVIGFPLAQYRMHEQQKTSTVEKYQPELLQVRDSLQKQFNRSTIDSKLPTRERKSLKIVCLNDTGNLGGAGIAHQRITQALALAGHEVCLVTGTLDWSLTPVDCTVEEVERTVASLNPDLLVIGNIHNFKCSIEILEKLSYQYPTVFIMHDQWLMTGRCGYTGNCEGYTSLCDAECPTWEQYPRLAPTKIFDAFTRKQALVQNNDQLLILSDSQWLTNWSRYAYLNHFSQDDYIQIDKKFQHIYYGLDLELFRPYDKIDSRRQLGLSEDQFIILTGSQSLEDERKGFKYLLQALEIANLADVLVLCFGHDFQVATQLKIKSIGYINNPSLLARYYSAADLFVSPALEEAFGQTFIEAAACGTPAVGFGAGGVREAISNRVSGRIVNQKKPKALAKIIQELYHDRPQLELLSKLAPWHIANNFSFTASYHSIISTWENSNCLSDLRMATVSKFSVQEIPQSKFITIKGGKTQDSSNNFNGIEIANNPLPRKILMDRFLQGSGWFPAENINGISARWMTDLGTIIIDPIDYLSQPLQLEVSGIIAVDLELLKNIVIKINGNLITTTIQHRDNGSWICNGDISPDFVSPKSVFILTIEVAETKPLSPSDPRKGSLLVESLLIKSKTR